MNFEEWYNKTYSKGCSDSHKLNAKTAWNAAIEEAIGSAWNADDGGDESGGAALSRAEENMESLKA